MFTQFHGCGFWRTIKAADGSCQAGLICRSPPVRRFRRRRMNYSQVGGGGERRGPAEAGRAAGGDQGMTGQNSRYDGGLESHQSRCVLAFSKAWWGGLHPRVQFHTAWFISSGTGSSSVLQLGCFSLLSIRPPPILLFSSGGVSGSMCCLCTLVPINKPWCFSSSGLIKAELLCHRSEGGPLRDAFGAKGCL